MAAPSPRRGARSNQGAAARARETASASAAAPASSQQPNKLFIGGLSYDTTDESLCRYFAAYGPVEAATVMRDPATSRSRGFGFVTFSALASASRAAGCTHHLVDGRKVEAKFAVPRVPASDAPASPAKSSPRKAPSASANAHANVNARAQGGRARRDKGPRSPPASPRGWAESEGSGGSEAPEELVTSHARRPSASSSDGIGERFGDPALPPPDGVISNKIFVGGLPYATGHESLRAFFERFGEVHTAEVIYNRETRKSRGFGFVIFHAPRAVDAVLAAQDARGKLALDGKQVEVKPCVPRQEPSTAGSAASHASSGSAVSAAAAALCAARPPPLSALRGSASTPVSPAHSLFPTERRADFARAPGTLTHAASFDAQFPLDAQQLRRLHSADAWQHEHADVAPRRAQSISHMFRSDAAARFDGAASPLPDSSGIWGGAAHMTSSPPPFARSHSMGAQLFGGKTQRADSGSTTGSVGPVTALDLDALGADALSGLTLDEPAAQFLPGHRGASPLSARSAPSGRGFGFSSNAGEEALDPFQSLSAAFQGPEQQYLQQQQQQQMLQQQQYQYQQQQQQFQQQQYQHQLQQQQQQPPLPEQGYGGYFGPPIPE